MALVPKKSIALQAGRAPSPDVTPISGRSGVDVAASSASQALPAVVLMPSVGQADAGAEEAPSGVIEHMTTEVIPPPMSEWMELPLALVAPSVVGAAPQAEAPASQAEVAATVTSQAQPDTATVVSEGAARSVPPAAQATVPEAGRMEGDTAGGYRGVV